MDVELSTEYASNKEYSQAIKLADELKAFCSLHHIPMMTTIAKEENGDTKYINSIVTPLEAKVELTDDRISQLNVAFSKGFYLKIKTPDMDDDVLMMDDLFED